jgi:hypothetical protein
MAIAYIGTAAATPSASPKTVSYTCGSGTNRCLVVVAFDGTGTGIPSSVKYANVSMTPAAEGRNSFGGGLYKMNIYVLAGPVSGTNDVVITGTGNWGCHILEFTGVDQTTPAPDKTERTETTSNTNSTQTITVTYDNSMLVASTSEDGTTSISGGTNTTKVQESGQVRASGYSTTVVAAGSRSLAWSEGTCNWGGAIIALKEAASGTAYTATPSGTIGTSDSKTVQWAAVLAKAETLGVAQVQTRQSAQILTPTNTVSLTDIVSLVIPTNYTATVLNTLSLNSSATAVGVQRLTITVAEMMVMSDVISARIPGEWIFRTKNTAGTWAFRTKNTAGTWIFRPKSI